MQEGGEVGGEGGSVEMSGDERRGVKVVREGEEGPRDEGEDSDADMFSVMSQVLFMRKSPV